MVILLLVICSSTLSLISICYQFAGISPPPHLIIPDDVIYGICSVTICTIILVDLRANEVVHPEHEHLLSNTPQELVALQEESSQEPGYVSGGEHQRPVSPFTDTALNYINIQQADYSERVKATGINKHDTVRNQDPKLPLYLQLDNPQKIYHGGEAIKGTVVLTPVSEEEVEELTVHIRAKVSIPNGMSPVPDPSQLFEHSKTIFKENYTFSAATRYTWPFQIDFPTGALNDYSGDNWNYDPPWPYDYTHPLPPTFSFFDKGGFGTFECYTEYILDVEFIRPKTTFPRLLNYRVSLPFSPIRESREISPLSTTQEKRCTCRSFALDPGYQGGGPSLYQRMMSSTGSSSVPSSAFAIAVEIPKQVVQGGNIPLVVNVRQVSSSSDGVPVVKLQHLIVTAIAITEGRTPAFPSSFRFFCRPSKVPIVDRPSEEILSGDSLDLSTVFDELNACNLPLDFSTYDIRRRYVLEVKIAIRYADQIFTFKCEYTGFHVLSPFSP